MILNKINREKPNKLFHYSDLTSFIGIISNNEFWLSNLYFQNDKHEYQLGLKREKLGLHFSLQIIIDLIRQSSFYLLKTFSQND